MTDIHRGTVALCGVVHAHSGRQLRMSGGAAGVGGRLPCSTETRFLSVCEHCGQWC